MTRIEDISAFVYALVDTTVSKDQASILMDTINHIDCDHKKVVSINNVLNDRLNELCKTVDCTSGNWNGAIKKIATLVEDNKKFRQYFEDITKEAKIDWNVPYSGLSGVIGGRIKDLTNTVQDLKKQIASNQSQVDLRYENAKSEAEAARLEASTYNLLIDLLLKRLCGLMISKV